MIVDYLAWILIVRFSVMHEYHPIPGGVLYGLALALGSMLNAPGAGQVITVAAVGALVAAGFLRLLQHFETMALVWWPLFVGSLSMPFLVMAAVGR